MPSKSYINCAHKSHLDAALTLTHIANERGSDHHEVVHQEQEMSGLLSSRSVFQHRQHELEKQLASYARISNNLQELQKRHDAFQTKNILPLSSRYAYVLDIKPIPISSLEFLMARNNALLTFDDRCFLPRLPPPHLMNLPTKREDLLSEPRSNICRHPRQLRNTTYYTNDVGEKKKHLISSKRRKESPPKRQRKIQKDPIKQADPSCTDGIPPICTKGGVKAPFPVVLWRILHTIETKERHFESIMSWQSNISFRVHDKKKFEQCIQPRFFNQTNYTSFRRQLNLWGFQRIPVRGELGGAYFHPSFKRDDEYSCRTMRRPCTETTHSSKSGK
ncbi:hypothetical protein CTEN210_12238 [Chaetoceros tenuissimus]|uniref:HSF-type DNA-binding domain-containing protein n=1 Tax=Chaetoceros tenuissimus TaxID=426638 RepID=A0AAD3D188_9STRA|nr:hypothetical protein CTEN210_12238 [Chaetoceros tenuissimus]